MSIWSVLVVDDNPAIRKSIRELYAREADFEVCGEAENGKEAIELAQRLKPALIVSDISMPEMNGLEETRILHEMMPRVRVILYSAHADPFTEREGLAVGAVAVLSKSDAASVLIAKSRALLAEKAA